MYQRDPSDTIIMIHHEIGTLQWRMAREHRHFDQLAAAIKRDNKINSCAAFTLANDVRTLRNIADALEAAWEQLIIRDGEGKPCLDSLFADSAASCSAAA